MTAAPEEHALVILGGGPAGLTAGIYAARGRLDVILLEAKPLTGGQIATTDIVENYPGFPEPVSGAELMDRMRKQAERFGLPFATADITKITPRDDGFLLEGARTSYLARAVIVATGTEPRRLGVPGEKEFWGMGVTTCATCDGPLYRDKPVAVVGGGDSAVKEAVYLTNFASVVYLLHRRDRLRAETVIQEQALANDKIDVRWDTVVTAMLGDAESGLTGLALQNVKTEEASELAVDCVFLYVGVLANTDMVEGLVALDDAGLIITDNDMATNVPGIFAAGDCRSKTLKQVATAVGEGAAAAFSAQEYLTGGPYGAGC
ncbi:MAG: thioredoxin-disulfide reductase [Candidatus Coatesbacteria bacterium]|nr:MAG: thioredoxin-disulfide reductase [Candidatus Coatesbacteria bacterium]